MVVQEQAADLLLTVRDNLLTFGRFHGHTARQLAARIEEVMSRFGLDTLADRKVQDLSRGARRRVQVAKVFLVRLPVVFLDEFSTGMDALLKRSVMDLIRADAAGGRTFILTTHILSEAEDLCDDILIINGGRQVARGSVASLKLLTRSLYEVTIRFERVPDELEAVVSRYEPSNMTVVHNAVSMRLKRAESDVIDLLSTLSKYGRVEHVEIGGATLEDIFVELLQKPEVHP